MFRSVPDALERSGTPRIPPQSYRCIIPIPINTGLWDCISVADSVCVQFLVVLDIMVLWISGMTIDGLILKLSLLQ